MVKHHFAITSPVWSENRYKSISPVFYYAAPPFPPGWRQCARADGCTVSPDFLIARKFLIRRKRHTLLVPPATRVTEPLGLNERAPVRMGSRERRAKERCTNSPWPFINVAKKWRGACERFCGAPVSWIVFLFCASAPPCNICTFEQIIPIFTHPV